MKRMRINSQLPIRHMIADTIEMYQMFTGDVVISEHDDIASRMIVPLEDIEESTETNGRDVLVTPYDLLRNFEVIRAVVCNPDRFCLCALYPTILFAQSILGNELEYITYPAKEAMLSGRHVIDLHYSDYESTFYEMGIDISGWNDILCKAMAVRNVTQPDGGIGIWCKGDAVKDGLSNVNLFRLVEELKGNTDKPIYLIGLPFVDESDDYLNYTGIFHDQIAILHFALGLDHLISVDSWVGRFAAKCGVDTVVLQGSYDDDTGATTLSIGDICDTCSEGCEVEICKRITDIDPREIVRMAVPDSQLVMS